MHEKYGWDMRKGKKEKGTNTLLLKRRK